MESLETLSGFSAISLSRLKYSVECPPAVPKFFRDASSNILPAKVVEIADENPAQVAVRLDAGGTLLLARITRKSSALLGLAPGMTVYAQIKSVALLE